MASRSSQVKSSKAFPQVREGGADLAKTDTLDLQVQWNYLDGSGMDYANQPAEKSTTFLLSQFATIIAHK